MNDNSSSVEAAGEHREHGVALGRRGKIAFVVFFVGELFPPDVELADFSAVFAVVEIQ